MCYDNNGPEGGWYELYEMVFDYLKHPGISVFMIFDCCRVPKSYVTVKNPGGRPDVLGQYAIV
jgi:hypothetical protein